jgi:ATP-dependent DNA helicase RecG
VEDLLLDLPRKVETFVDAGEERWLAEGERARVEGTIAQVNARVVRARTGRRLPMTAMEIDADRGGRLHVTWFNQDYLARQFRVGDRIAVAGAVRYRGNRPEMANPAWERAPAGRPLPEQVGGSQPIYGLTQDLTQKRIRGWIEGLLEHADQIEDPLPAWMRDRFELLPLGDTLRLAHQPESPDDLAAAVGRMERAELIELQLAFAISRQAREEERAAPIPYRQEVIDQYKESLPFELTRPQKQAIWDVYKDIEHDRPMNRMLDGDVGSGKTAVAAAAVAMAAAAGQQSVLLAPTEILARQHLAKCRDYLEHGFGDLRVDLLISGLPAAERRRVRTAAASGHSALVVGTHALLEDEVQFQNLGLAIVDEQHRFGTHQRELLRAKLGELRPHVLALTATPIPRSLALAYSGEMDVSVIDELPAGRIPVVTHVLKDDKEAFDLIRAEVRAGHQAFVICPLIEGSETSTGRAATDEYERLRTKVFPDLRVALVHGRVRNKEEVMQQFRDGAADILVATSVIEVGVDVPNATVMLVEGAEHFGLAQLHQFRGRVGRSDLQSYCLLLPDQSSEKVAERLGLLEQVNDGFRLAEADLKIRGPGELIGTRQHGDPDELMRAMANPRLLGDVQAAVAELLERDPELESVPILAARARARLEQTTIN